VTDAARVHLSRTEPEAYKALAALASTVGDIAKANGISPVLRELVQLRVSQINGCAFCLRVHTTKALAAGESVDRLGLVAAWRETSVFTDTERAALDLAESMTLIQNGHVPDEVYERVRRVLNEREYTAIAWIAVSINAFNRVAITSRYLVEPEEAPQDAPTPPTVA
jgi:AhpD family alkylhydroperoxidase